MGIRGFTHLDDPELALWHALVIEQARAEVGGTDAELNSHRMVVAINKLAAESQETRNTSLRTLRAVTEDTDAVPTRLMAISHDLARTDEPSNAENLRSLFDSRNFSDADIAFIRKVLAARAEYAQKELKYEKYRNLEFGVIKYQLPKNAKVLILGDWGTGEDDAQELLERALQAHDPDAIIHLGDVYYAGLPKECLRCYVDVFAHVFKKLDREVPVFSIPGNHEYYAKGHGFYNFILPAMNEGDTKQHASYFCLRTEDAKWQFLGMDTGHKSSRIFDELSPTAKGPELPDREFEWHEDKLENFPGSTILLSHHQLFSAHARINGVNSGSSKLHINEHLYGSFKRYFDRISAWLWGHEHCQVLYKNDLFGLAKGRLIGASAWNERTSDHPYEIVDGARKEGISYIENDEKYRLHSNDGYFNLGYVVLDLGATGNSDIKATYYEFPSWEGNNRPTSIEIREIYNETFEHKPKPKPQPRPQPLKYGDEVQLSCTTGHLSTSVKAKGHWYPELSANGSKATLRVTGKTAGSVVSKGDLVRLECTEPQKKGCLAAFKLPSLYYYEYEKKYEDQMLWEFVYDSANLVSGSWIHIKNKHWQNEHGAHRAAPWMGIRMKKWLTTVPDKANSTRWKIEW